MPVTESPTKVYLFASHTQAAPLVVDTPASAMQTVVMHVHNLTWGTVLARQTRDGTWVRIPPRSFKQVTVEGYPPSLELAVEQPLYRHISMRTDTPPTETPHVVELQVSQFIAMPFPAPEIISFVATDDKLTVGQNGELTAVFRGGTGTVNQAVGSVTTAVAKALTGPAVTTTYTLSVDNGEGKVATLTETVEVYAAPIATSLTPGSASIAAGASTTLTAVFSNGTGVITPGNVEVTSGVAITVTPAVTTEYTLTVTNPAGQTDTDAATITVT